MENLDIRLMIAESGLKHKDIAKKIGISAVHLSRLMGSPLSQKNRIRIINAIEELKEERRNEG